MKKLTIPLTVIVLCFTPVIKGADEKGVMVGIKTGNRTEKMYFPYSSIESGETDHALAKCRSAVDIAIRDTKRTGETNTILITVEESPRPISGAMLRKVKSLTPEDVLKFKAAQILGSKKVKEFDLELPPQPTKPRQ